MQQTTRRPGRFSPEALASMAMALWVVVETFGSLAGREMPTLQVVWLRYAFHAAFLLLVFTPARGASFLRSRQPWLQIGRSLLMAVMPVSFILGRPALGTSVLMAFFWMAPALVLVFARSLGERVPASAFLPVMAAWGGALLIYQPGLRAVQWPLVFAVTMAASFALYIVATPVLDRTDGVLTNLFYSAVGVLIALAPAMVFVWRTPSAAAWVAAAGVGIAGLFALYLLDLALRRASASRLGPFLFAQIPATVLLEALIERSFGGAAAWLGTAIVVGAMASALIRHSARAASRSEPIA